MANVLYTVEYDQAAKLAEQGWHCWEKHEANWNKLGLAPGGTRVIYVCRKPIPIPNSKPREKTIK